MPIETWISFPILSQYKTIWFLISGFTLHKYTSSHWVSASHILEKLSSDLRKGYTKNSDIDKIVPIIYIDQEVTLKDISKANKEGIQKLGAKGIVEIDNQLKIILGPDSKQLKKYIK